MRVLGDVAGIAARMSAALDRAVGVDHGLRAGRRAEEVELPRAFAAIDDDGIRHEALLRFCDLWGVHEALDTLFFEPEVSGLLFLSSVADANGFARANGFAGAFTDAYGFAGAPPFDCGFFGDQATTADDCLARSEPFGSEVVVRGNADAVA